MKIRWLLAAGLLVCAAPVPAEKTPPTPLAPAEAIAAVNRSVSGVRGRFEMTVSSSKKGRPATYLDSGPDYRAPGNVTFSLSPAVALILKKRFGAPPEEYLRGKRIVVHGIMEKRLVANVERGRPVSFNRFHYGVEVRQVAQIVSIE